MFAQNEYGMGENEVMDYKILAKEIGRPLDKILRAIDYRIYTVIRWKMRRLVNPMGTGFLFPFIVRKGDTVIDIGANTGTFTLPLARLVGANGSVYAFEPIAKNFSELCEKVKSERLSSRIVLNQLALSDSAGYATFTIPRDCYTQATLMPHQIDAWVNYNTEKEKFDTERCEIITLDEFVKENKIGHISFIKCDVEGSELQVLKGARSVLRRPTPPCLILEVFNGWTKDFGYHPRDLFEFLRKEGGYEFYWINEAGLKRVKSDDEIIPGIFSKWIDYLCIVPDIHSKRLKVERYLV